MRCVRANGISRIQKCWQTRDGSTEDQPRAVRDTPQLLAVCEGCEIRVFGISCHLIPPGKPRDHKAVESSEARPGAGGAREAKGDADDHCSFPVFRAHHVTAVDSAPPPPPHRPPAPLRCSAGEAWGYKSHRMSLLIFSGFAGSACQSGGAPDVHIQTRHVFPIVGQTLA
ncbi:hypothetical protein THAOC_00903 [Thalassiosira oceanica]|uniref:Uncharacterized protein n=1 Tax=Thalassiosira oceanica TaxID=159749 RepID=K0TJG6_THAOC|nr:hypothetical protein THAOC_00903 [Thalassiosira oceanica]|eukprot:EJK77274.1 hypothetical protein THAOC_00903 [Thalassiosira oceanica]